MVDAAAHFSYTSAISFKEGRLIHLSVTIILTILFTLIPAALFLYVIVLAIRALRTYIRTNGVRQGKNQIKRTLGEALKEHRLRCQMTQEFVAESVGVSRQAISKWERRVSQA